MCHAHVSQEAKANGANGHTNGHGTNGHALNGRALNGAKESLTAGNLYQLVLEARPPFGAEWFSITDTATRLGLAVFAFYRFLLTEPLALLRFAYGWNTLWCARRPPRRMMMTRLHACASSHFCL